MDRDYFLTRPWSSLSIPELDKIRAYTFLEERLVAVWLARECYSGAGEIIDAGAFFGGSALSLAIGLKANERVNAIDKVGRIHPFDNFMWAPWIRKNLLPENVKFGTSFLNVFHDTVVKYQEFLTIHPGDIEKRHWRLGPVELLFIDCAKSFESNATIIKGFFPSLIPGRSIVNQQDYAIASRLVWIHAAMEFFSDRFEDLGSTITGGTTLFRLTKAISTEDCSECIEALTADCLGLAQAAAERYPATDRRRNAILKSIESFQSDPLPLP